MKLEDVNKELQKLDIGSYSLVVNRAENKILVKSVRDFIDFNFKDFAVICTNEKDIPGFIEDFRIDDDFFN